MFLKEEGPPLTEHLTQAELQAALRDELSRARWQEIVRHLLGGCAECRTVLETGLHPEAFAVEKEADYDQALDVSFEYALRTERLFRNRQEPEKAAIMGQGARGKAGAPRDELGVLEALLKRSWAVRHDDPREMVRLARRAVEVALGLDPAVYGARRVADQQARAWGELANAQRVANNHWEAQRAFGEAFKLLERGTEDRLLKARLHDLHASLLGTQRRFVLAFEALDVVYDLYQEIGDVHLAGRSLITRAIYTHYSGRSEEALTLNERGLSLIDEMRDPGLTTVAVHNQLSFLVACGRFQEARKLLIDNPHCSRANGQLMVIRLRWLKGQIDEGLGNLATAEAVFREVKEELESLGMGFGAALATLDLALVWMRQGRIREAKEAVLEAAGVFAVLEIHREILGAVQLLKEAFRLEKVSVELIAETVAFLRDYWQVHPDSGIRSASS